MSLLLVSETASANKRQISIIHDDGKFHDDSAFSRELALDDSAALGADVVKALVGWTRIAPDENSTKKPTFNANDPAAYPMTNWDPFDDFVRGATQRDLKVMLVPTPPGPLWTSSCKGSKKKIRSCKPSPKEFEKFVFALGKRYSGKYKDENQGGATLPKVSIWAIGNEPGISGWIYPQYEKKSGKVFSSSAVTYRKLVYSAEKSLKKTGHKKDLVMLGEFNPVGRTSGNLAKRTQAPAYFIRELFCVDKNGSPLKGKDAKVRSGCRKFKKFGLVNAIAHHPYTRAAANPPLTRDSGPDDITYRSLNKLPTLLKKISQRSKRVKSNMPVYLTEYGIQTNPPNTRFGQSEKNQARYINQSDAIAYGKSFIYGVAQYQVIDEGISGPFQTGLRFESLEKKQSWDAYRLPIYVKKRGNSKVNIYGQVRPAANGSSQVVEIQKQSGNSFKTVQKKRIKSQYGHFTTTLKQRGGKWRLLWVSPNGEEITSRIAAVERK